MTAAEWRNYAIVGGVLFAVGLVDERAALILLGAIALAALARSERLRSFLTGG